MDIAARLKIMDVVLWETHLARQVEYPRVEDNVELEYQTMREIKADSVGALAQDGNELDILKVFVSLGVRCLMPAREDKEAEVLHTLESVFAVDYLCVEPVSDEDVQEFASFNSVHNVWPFWRQHVYDTMKKASLPVPAVPFFPGRPKPAE
jgi:hypothetical protein